MTRSRRRAGKYAKSSGSSWEASLAAYHRALASAGMAVVNKTGPEVTMSKNSKGEIVPVVVGPGVADYAGCIDTGVFVGFDAKSTNELQGFTLPKKTLHQKRWMESIHKLSGGAAFVFYLVYWRRHGQIRLHWVHSIPDRRIRFEDGYELDGIDWYGFLTT